MQTAIPRTELTKSQTWLYGNIDITEPKKKKLQQQNTQPRT
jgi:hypothetical protein